MESSTNIVRAKIDENCWVLQIKECLDVLQQQEEEEVLRVSVFNVPKDLLALKPEAYIPQLVSIGPYHHWRSDLNDMERFKLGAALRFQKRMNGRKFEIIVVEEFKKHDWQIRSCYHKFINYKEETLAWLMALDATFLLECLQFYERYSDQSSHTEFEQLGRDLDLSGTSARQNAIVRDVMMLENQLPLFLLQKLLELLFEGCKTKAEERLRRLLRLVWQELSPFTFKLPEDSKVHIDGKGHVLEVLYYWITPLSNNQNPSPFEQDNDAPDTSDMSTNTRAFSLLWNTLSSLKVGPVQFLTDLPRRLLNWRPLQFVMKLPLAGLLATLAKLPVLSAFKRPLAFLVHQDAIQTEEEGEVEESSVKIILPTTDELDIPSVADLYFAGVKFSPTHGDLTTIRFDKKTATLYLPKVKLNSNTEVILRNLVAFEASGAPVAHVFRRYIDFMNGMIDCEEDVRLLRKMGVISNYLQSDQEVASLWNSMGKCVHFTKVAYLDKVIEDLNGYYKNRWKVIVVELANKHIFRSWKFLSLLATVILLVVTCLQAFCSVYDCEQWLDQSKLLKD